MVDSAELVAARIRFDLSQLPKDSEEAKKYIDEVNKSLASIKPAKPSLDTEETEKRTTKLRGMLDSFAKFLTHVPKGVITLETGTAEQNAGALRTTIASLAGELGGLRALGGLGSILGAGSAIAVIGATIIQFVKLNETMREVRAIMSISTGATGDDLKRMESVFRTVASTSSKSWQELGTVVSSVMGTFNVAGNQAVAITKSFLDLAKATGTEAASNIRIVSQIMHAYGLTVKDVTNLNSQFAAASQRSGIPVAELQQQVLDASAALTLYGVNAQNAIRITTELDRVGIQSTDIINGLRTSYENIVGSQEDANAALIKFIENFSKIDDVTFKNSEALKLFGRSGLVMVQALESGAITSETFKNKQLEATEAFSKGGEDAISASSNWDKAISNFGLAVSRVSTEIARQFKENNKEIIEGIRLVAEFMNKWATGGESPQEAPTTNPIQQQIDKQSELRDKIIGMIEVEKHLLEIGRGKREHIDDLVSSYVEYTLKIEELTAALNEEKNVQKEASSEAEETSGKINQLMVSTRDLNSQLAASGQNRTMITFFLDLNQATTKAQEGVNNLKDRAIAASIQALIGYANAAETAEEELARMQDAADASAIALEREAKHTAMDTAAKEVYESRLTSITQGAMNQYTLKQQQQMAAQIAAGEQIQVATKILQDYGYTQEEVGRIIASKGKDFDEWLEKFVKYANRLSEVKVLELQQEQTAGRMLDTLVQGFTEVERAQIKFRQQTEQNRDISREAYAAMGGDLRAYDAAMAGTIEQQNKFMEQVKAAQKFAQTGFITPVKADSMKDATDIYQEALSEATKKINEAHKSFAEGMAAAENVLRNATKNVNKTLESAFKDYAKTIAQLDAELANIDKELAARLRQIQEELDKELGNINKQRVEAQKTYEKSVIASNERLQKALDDAQEQYAKTVQDLSKQATAAVEASVQSQSAAFRSLASALAAIRQQDIESANAYSQQMEDLQRKAFAPGGAEDTSRLAQERIRLQAQEGLRAQARTEQERQARQRFGESVQDAIIELANQMKEIAEAEAEAAEQRADAENQARTENQKQLKELNATLEKTFADLAKAEARAQAEAAVARAKAAADAEKRKKEIEKLKEEAKQRLEEAKAAADEQLNEAKADFEETQRELKEEMARAEERFLQEAALARADWIASVANIGAVLPEMRDAVIAGLGRKAVEVPVSFNNSTIQETGVDYVRVFSDQVQRRMQFMNGGRR